MLILSAIIINRFANSMCYYKATKYNGEYVMKKLFKSTVLVLLALTFILSLAACGADTAKENAASDKEETADSEAKVIKLSADCASIDGEEIEQFDYTWHCDPSVSHDEVDNAPAEYYTGTKPETNAAVYIDNELYYFPQLAEGGFKAVDYDGETEWAYYYTDGKHDDFIFATLPKLGNEFPSQMMHSEEEAAENKVLHITQPGTYMLEGEWQGQIWVDLGDKDDTFSDENAKVTLILNGVNINCSVAPGVVFYSAYECDNTWEDSDSHSENVNTDNAGVTVIIADGSENTVDGTNVFRMLKTKYKDENSNEEVKLQKKMRKNDAAFYSYVSMNIEGEEEGTGILNINSGFEGLDSELHLAINGGNITVNSQDDGINVNEDNVSVAAFNGGEVTINAALGAEGDGVDSNGYIVLNGGKVSVNGIVPPDSALDSENGIYYNAGTVVIDGEEQSYTSGAVFNETGMMDNKGENGNSGGMEKPGGMQGNPGESPMGSSPADFDIKEFKAKVAALGDDATFEDVMNLLGADMQQPGGQMPNEAPSR